jgi:O-succinylbenzoic acid--CoA ligase
VNRDAPAVVSRSESLSYGALERRVAAAAGALRSLGVRDGTRVGLWAENSVEWIVIALAVARTGGVLVPLNTRLADPEIAWQIARAAVSLVIASDPLAGRAAAMPSEVSGKAGASAPRVVSLSEWGSIAPREGAVGAEAGDPERPAVIVFTSGTTGRPKGALLTLANQLASARAAASVLRLADGDRWLASLPFFHVGGLGIVQRCLLAGACVALPESFSAESLGRAVEALGVSHISAVDATLRRMLEARAGRALPDRVRAVVVGGGPMSPGLLDACPQALASYGLTESCAMVTLVRPGAERRARLTAGRPLPGVDLRIAEDGVIEVRGPMVMRGYLDDAAATAAALRDGWLRTGDLGEMEPDGSLRVLSRRDDLIISGGENVYPAEIEHVLREHPEVADAVVVGTPDEAWGEVPLALVELRHPGAPDLRAFLEPRLARYKLPRIVFVEAIPRLANGKPDRAAIKCQPSRQPEHGSPVDR